jgi:hypothetical protein
VPFPGGLVSGFFEPVSPELEDLMTALGSPRDSFCHPTVRPRCGWLMWFDPQLTFRSSPQTRRSP